MELIADGLLIATALTAGLYCLVLSRRLARLTESGNGIGPQIEALDRALNETRAALTETREGLVEMRGSARAAIAQLAGETERAEVMAQRIERGVETAKATMQRLYEAGDRIEAHEQRTQSTGAAGGAGTDGIADARAGQDAPGTAVQPAEGPDREPAREEDTGAPAGDTGEPENRAPPAGGPRAETPVGDRPAPVPESGTRDQRAGAIKSAQRVIL